MIGIYKLTSPSGKSYIGQSIDIDNRFCKYKNKKCKEQRALYNAICKYGFENFDIDIIYSSKYFDKCKNILNKLEFGYIRKLNTMHPNGYNLKDGGNSNGRLSDETKRRIGIGNLGKKHPHSIESKLKISKALTGTNRPQCVKDKISKSNSGKIRSNDFKNFLKTVNIGRTQSKDTISKRILKINKPILMYSSDGVFIREFSSIKEASIKCGFNRTGISKCLNGIQKTSKSFI